MDQCPRVAVRENARTVLDESLSVLADRATVRDVLIGKSLRRVERDLLSFDNAFARLHAHGQIQPVTPSLLKRYVK